MKVAIGSCGTGDRRKNHFQESSFFSEETSRGVGGEVKRVHRELVESLCRVGVEFRLRSLSEFRWMTGW